MGKNQFGPVCESGMLAVQFIPYPFVIIVPADNPVLQEALEKYHRGLITDNTRISKLLQADYGIDMKYAQALSCF